MALPLGAERRGPRLELLQPPGHLSGDGLPEKGSPGAGRAERGQQPRPSALGVLVPGPESIWLCLDFPVSSLLWASTSVLSTMLTTVKVPPNIPAAAPRRGAAHTIGGGGSEALGGNGGSREDVIWPKHAGDPCPFC